MLMNYLSLFVLIWRDMILTCLEMINPDGIPNYGTAENAVTVTAETDSFFTTTSYIGAVEDSTDTWYKGWTVPGSLD